MPHSEKHGIKTQIFSVKSENTVKWLFNTQSYAKARSTKIQNIVGWNITPDFRAGV